MADIGNIVSGYINLLIIQYATKPKARAIIELFVSELLANGILQDIRDAYNVDTATGRQLDILGKYVGVDRFYKNQDLKNYFAVTNYDEEIIDVNKFGFVNYSNSDDAISNGTLDYNDVIQANFRLNDDSYRILIKLKIIQNHSNHSHKSIDDSIYNFFGSTVIPSSDGKMDVYYFIPKELEEVIKAAIFKQVMPRPMGVSIGYIAQESPFFAFTGYENNNSANINITGFTDYDSGFEKSGASLDFNKVNNGE
ncbi:MAG: DUF2612 domain-containing protein [Rickettsiales bacterium]